MGNVSMPSIISGVTNPIAAMITTSTTTVIKSGSGRLYLVVVTGLGSIASSTIIYDNTSGSGTVIDTINTLIFTGIQNYSVPFTTGLTLVTTGIIAPRIVVVYD